MQLKKMREVLPTLYASQVNNGHSSLTISPKQGNVAKSNPMRTNDKNSSFGYQKTEETELHLITCVKCRCVEEASVLELLKERCQRGQDDHFVCNKCQPSMSSILNFVIDPTGGSGPEDKGKMSLSKTLRMFKLKNFQPNKYYCDKCRFSTKNPLQYKKHLAQHKEVKFICSQCKCVSYTRGEFQRHMVKHTGRFPYQCDYCEYGTVRHDYIVKHTRRSHETVADEPIMLTAAKDEEKTNCLLNQNPVRKALAKGTPLQKKSSGLNIMTFEIQDDISEAVNSRCDTECSQRSTCVLQRTQDTCTDISSDVKIQKNVNAIVEVEVYSPHKSNIMPEMPLTVVAPPKFVVPPNCLAQIVELKNVNGTQHLILKLIPLRETSFISNEYKETEQGEKINRCMSPAHEELNALENEYQNSECSSFSSSTSLNCNIVNLQQESIICKENIENVHDISSSVSVSDGINCLEQFQKKACAENKHTNYNLEPSVCLASSAEGKDVSENYFFDAVQENNRVPPSVIDKMRPTLSNVEEEHRNDFKVASKMHLVDSSLSYPLETVEETQQNNSPPMNDSKNGLGVVNGENVKNKYNHMESAEDVKDVSEALEGPVISSVFSLSAGAVNIPEGIRWDNGITKKNSTSLLCRKIAQLMSAVESNMKSQLAASLRQHKSQDTKDKVLSSSEEKNEGNDLTTEVQQEIILCPQRTNEASSSNQFSNKKEQEQPVETLRNAVMKARVANKMCVASPVFIPQGTVLKVLNSTSTEGSTEKENGNGMFPYSSMYCNQTFLPRPVPCCISERPAKDLSLLSGNETNEASRKQRVSSRNATKRQSVVKSNSQQNRVLPHPKCNELNMPNKRDIKGEEPQHKSRQLYPRENLYKKRPRTPEDCFLKIVPDLMRRLRIIPFKSDQLIKCPHRNQPVVVLNHPDVDSPEIINVMKVINKYKSNVLKAVLSERTINCLGERRHKKLMFQNFDTASEIKKQSTLKMKLKKIHKNSYKVVNSSPSEASKLTFKCWFCGRTYIDQEEWISHGQKHLLEATRGWDILSLTLESEN
ncbi:zinc finger protein 518B [Varanus komodoensis]|uniref:Zinc finger protein 518B n=1 Tax=Varanus komodoensis TaxID=61221 RepID=A0A8D2IRX9_VARKO|nr:zinc finger protein 518B [Varanus komodoensis]XP_044274269.1 zinc finger protein 518B [Varanus komodoensis]XP_044274270.1 zinc finger protein 518B [Varanus komodoensis]XP_044274271.1 zinc finger protein 518B [Varanus komodoensis]